MKRFGILFLKWLLVALSLGYILYKLWHEKQTGILYSEFKQIDSDALLFLLAVFVLSFVNWGIESLKWKQLLVPLQFISYINALKSVLAGVSVSIFTPNRVGEFGGRIFLLKPENRIPGIAATLIGNIAQLLTTLVIGLFGLVPFFIRLQTSIRFPIDTTWLFLTSLVVIIIGLYVYFNVSKFEMLLAKIKRGNRYLHYFRFMKVYNSWQLLHILFLSLIRYLVFSIQFIFLLYLFGIELNMVVLFVVISQIYLIMTLIPTFALTEVGIRGSVATLVLDLYTPLTAGVVAASVTLWIINIALPALVGSWILLKHKTD